MAKVFTESVEIQVLGVNRRIGTGKDGKPYDFGEVHFCYPNRFVTGQAVASCRVNGSNIDSWGLVPGVVVCATLLVVDYNVVNLTVVG